MRPDQIWQAALGELQLQLTKSTFDTWLSGVALLSSDDDVFVLGVENGYAKDWLESRLMSTLKRTLAGITGKAIEVRVVVYGDSHSLAADESTDIEPEEVWEPDWREIGVPLIFENETLETLDWTAPALQKPELADYTRQAVTYLQAGIGLTLIGPAGVGKTHLAVGVLKQAVEDGWTATFVDVDELADRVLSARDTSRRSGRAALMDKILSALLETELLVLDDLNANTLEPSVSQMLAKVIKRRWKRKAPVIVTTNCLLDELAHPANPGTAGLDDSTLSRLTGATVVLTLTGSDRRLVCKRQSLAHIRNHLNITGAITHDSPSTG